MKSISIKKRHQIPSGYYLVCIVGKTTASRSLKNIAELLFFRSYGPELTDFWILIFDSMNLLHVNKIGGNLELAKIHHKQLCSNLRDLPRSELKKIYFNENPESLAEKYQDLLELKWLESCLVTSEKK